MNHDIVVIGASTGGIETLSAILTRLPATLSASIFIVQHTSPMSKGYLAQILNNLSELEVVEAKDNEPIKKGYVYVAPADYHLLIKDEHTKLVRGPKENRSRPAIDPLFRSAAASYTSRVIGVILSGALNDGTAGLLSIKDCGGIAIAQLPSDAICASMPQSAVDNVELDYCLPALQIADKLIELVNQKAENFVDIPEEILIENTIAENGMSTIKIQDDIGKASFYSCPECGGRLWEMNKDNQFKRYRCHIGHAFTAANILSESTQRIDDALEVALRTLKEKSNLLKQMAEDARVLGQSNIANIYESQVKETNKQANAINALLMQR